MARAIANPRTIVHCRGRGRGLKALTAARISLRPATRYDLSQVERWYAETAALACTDATLERRVADAAASKGELLIIATADDPAPIGLLDSRVDRPEKGWFTTVFVALAAGRRGWGYGSEAVRLVEESSTVTRFLAEVDVRNGLGLYFWLRLGYRPARAGEVFWHSPDGGGIIPMVREEP